ncbi:hypothetical protein M422DRAFT_250050 [Sphaerobolus stellatus SS14]|nr:hypothetical protein M422DRAFT_250050 [Sphaerobolus stellatus SS14]
MANSSPSSQDIAESLPALAQEYSDSFAHVYVQFTALTLLVYDTFLTFPTELKLIWKGKLRIGAILYLMTRYVAILNITALGVGSYLLSSDKVSLNTTSCLLGLRAYAVAGLRRWVKIMLGFLFLSYLTLTVLSLPFVACDASPGPVTTLPSIGLDWLNSASLILFNGVVIGTTAFGAWSKGLELTVLYPIIRPLSLAQLLLRQGVMHFSLIGLWNLVDALSFKFGRPTLSGVDGAFNTAFSVILICRFMLDLRRANSQPNGTFTGHTTIHPVSSAIIAMILERVDQIILNEFGYDEEPNQMVS